MMDTDGTTVLDDDSGPRVALFNAGLARTFAKLRVAKFSRASAFSSTQRID